MSGAAKQKEIYTIQLRNKNDIVKIDGVIKEQVALETVASQLWNEKYGYMKDFNKICLEEAKKYGMSDEDYRRITVKRKGSNLPAVVSWEIQPSQPMPITSSGMIGWRSGREECNLEKLGSLYISPRHTMDCPDVPPSPPQKSIWLG